MRKLFLCSSLADSVHLFRQIVGETLKGKKLTLIPTAANVEDASGFEEDEQDILSKLEMAVTILDVSKESREQIAHTIRDADYIYLSGGNTFYLLQELKRHQVDRLLIEEINAGKFVIGESAGAIVMAPDIAYIMPMDDETKAPLLETYEGLGVVDFYPLPHMENVYLNEYAEQIMAMYDDKLNLVPLTDQQAIYVENDQIEIL
ncbi:Type 1 glutamine amidotransferase-like domain-containing protein [Vagococcus acidifermentans]|uniref:Peptidase S51 n=1 Tax=Vagococcus acidifermentans TaxID=564710 RepID=A0A430AVQ7_9ENTE|nr:Type 1 glutamine amidotransferase-like domain-containing protein [Vagococcus acidifermentans]RSU12142.1 hypothetical protein CBF27_06880 [Vagococcus acidifermentans]